MELKNNPIKIVVMQFMFKEPIQIRKVLDYDSKIKTFLKTRIDNFNTNIEIREKPKFGITNLKGNTDVDSYSYDNEDRTFRVQFEQHMITFESRQKYTTLEVFKDSCFEILNQIDFVNEVNMQRLSLRYVNDIKLPKDIQNIQDYINQTISSNENAEIKYPILNFSFRFSLEIENKLFSILNHSLERTSNDDIDYFLDIDVIDLNDYVFSFEEVSKKLDKFRAIKNNLFFNSITDKTIELCS